MYSDGERKVSIAAWHVVPNHIAKRFHKQMQLGPETLKNITNDRHYNEHYRDDPAENSYKVIEAMLRTNFDARNTDDEEMLFEEILRKTKDPIVLYLHGNTGTRANGHRVDLYKTLRQLGYHVIAMDYRGFADSSDISPTESGCVSDSYAMYRYIRNLTSSPVFVYGHSLGRLISFAIRNFLITTKKKSLPVLLYVQELELAYTWCRLSIKVTLTTQKVLF